MAVKSVKTTITIAVVTILLIVAVVVAYVSLQPNTSYCRPLNSSLAARIASGQKLESKDKVQYCKQPDSSAFKAMSHDDRVTQFNASYSISKQLYIKGDKEHAVQVANTALSSYQAMSQSERDQVGGIIIKLADLTDIKDGSY